MKPVCMRQLLLSLLQSDLKCFPANDNNLLAILTVLQNRFPVDIALVRHLLLVPLMLYFIVAIRRFGFERLELDKQFGHGLLTHAGTVVEAHVELGPIPLLLAHDQNNVELVELSVAYLLVESVVRTVHPSELSLVFNVVVG